MNLAHLIYSLNFQTNLNLLIYVVAPPVMVRSPVPLTPLVTLWEEEKYLSFCGEQSFIIYLPGLQGCCHQCSGTSVCVLNSFRNCLDWITFLTSGHHLPLSIKARLSAVTNPNECVELISTLISKGGQDSSSWVLFWEFLFIITSHWFLVFVLLH